MAVRTPDTMTTSLVCIALSRFVFLWRHEDEPTPVLRPEDQTAKRLGLKCYPFRPGRRQDAPSSAAYTVRRIHPSGLAPISTLWRLAFGSPCPCPTEYWWSCSLWPVRWPASPSALPSAAGATPAPKCG